MAWPLRRYFRLLWWTLCLLTFLALPLTIWEFQKQHYNVHYQAWFIGGIFVILSMPISIYEIAMHTEYYTQPRLQKHVIRILLMVPIYAMDAWFALRFRKAREYLDPVRECYEAFVIYSFFAYLMAYLQDTYGDLNELLSKHPQVNHAWGVRLVLRPWDMGTRFLWECKKGVLNYVILRPMCTSLAFITDIFDKYGEGQINFKKSYVYLAAVTNFSQLWALYCLVMLYTAMHAELAPIRPLSKFLCIKAVVFVTFWQGIAIAILVYAGVIRKESWTTYDKLNVASGIQDFLICIEMFLAALAHAYAFPPRDYMAGHSKGFFSNVRYIFDLRDVVDDVGLVVEEHVSSATTAVVKVPQRAVKKAAQGLAKNTKKLFGGGRGTGRLVDEEEEAASKCALLGTSPGPTPGTSSGASGRGLQSLEAGAGQWQSSGEGGGADGSGGGPLGGSSSTALQPLMPPQMHFMISDTELGNGAAAGSPSSPSTRGTYLSLPPLPPSTAALAAPAGGAASGSGTGAASGTGSGPSPGAGNAFNSLISSALYHTRGGYDFGSGSATGSGTGSNITRVTRRVSGSGGEHQEVAVAGAGPYAEYAEPYEAPSPALTAALATATGGLGGHPGVEVPLVAVGQYQQQQQQGRQAGSLVGSGEGFGRMLSNQGSGGSTGSGSGRSRAVNKAPRTGPGLLSGGHSGGGGGGGGGASSGEDSPYERLPMLPTSKRVHDE